MDLQEIDVTIDKNGQILIHVRGVKGKACLQLTQSLEETLGGDVVAREFTPEYEEEPGNTILPTVDLKQ